MVIRPKTTHGWRPISVKIQPHELANVTAIGRDRPRVPSHATPGVRPLRVSHRISAAPPAAKKPRPIMKRNDQ